MLSKEGFAIKDLCEAMGVSRAGYYKWLNRGESPQMLRRVEIIDKVRAVHEEHCTHGYRWIAAYLRDDLETPCSDSYIYQCCKYLGISAKTKHRKKSKPRKEKDKFTNWMYSTWDTVDSPRQVFVSDMTMLHTKGGDFELTMFFDVFTKQILVFEIGTQRGDRMPYIKGVNHLVEIYKSEGCTGDAYLHTDQGSVYASNEFNAILEKNNIVRSMSRAGKPTDNPVNEALNGRIKEELYMEYHIDDCTNRYDLEVVLKKYVDYYNNERPCYAIDYEIPNRYYQKFMDGQIERRNTFANRELNPEPKFVRARKAAAKKKAAEETAAAHDSQE